MWPQITNDTGRRTDGRTTCDRKNAPCAIVHRGVKMKVAMDLWETLNLREVIWAKYYCTKRSGERYCQGKLSVRLSVTLRYHDRISGILIIFSQVSKILKLQYQQRSHWRNIRISWPCGECVSCHGLVGNPTRNYTIFIIIIYNRNRNSSKQHIYFCDKVMCVCSICVLCRSNSPKIPQKFSWMFTFQPNQ